MIAMMFLFLFSTHDCLLHVHSVQRSDFVSKEPPHIMQGLLRSGFLCITTVHISCHINILLRAYGPVGIGPIQLLLIALSFHLSAKQHRPNIKILESENLQQLQHKLLLHSVTMALHIASISLHV